MKKRQTKTAKDPVELYREITAEMRAAGARAAAERAAARRAEMEKRDELAYGDREAEIIREAFEDGLGGGAAWWLYETLTEREKRRVAMLYDADEYDFSDGVERVEDDARFNGGLWAGTLPPQVLEEASRREFERLITEGEIVSTTWSENGKATETHGTPSVSVRDVKAYHWEKYVAEAGLVLDGEGEEARYYPRDVYARREAERQRERDEQEQRQRDFEEEIKIEMGKQEKLEREAAVGRARMAYEAALAGAGVPVAPDVQTTAKEQQPPAKRKRGRPRLDHGTPQARARAAAFCVMVEYAAKHPELSGNGARQECADEHGGDAAYAYFTDYENVKRWARRRKVQFSKLVETCRDDPKTWKKIKATLTK